MAGVGAGARERPYGPDRRDTWGTRARVLGVVRNLTSATRLRDVLSLLRRPDGIEVWYTVNPGSDFAAGLTAYLASVDHQERVLSWEAAVAGDFDLAVACAINPSMYELRAPLVVLPHGAGYNRLVGFSTGDEVSPAGLSRRELTHEGAVVPAVVGLSHPEQRARLARSCPEALPYAVVVGDPCFDRTTASLASRDRYRQAMGVADGRRLVVVNSTWSAHSLLGRHPGLPARLVAALPADEFRVALVAHPNVWAWHGGTGVHDQLAEALDAGLAVVPPQEGWRAALIAADVVVGDHGSTSVYGAALGTPTLLAADGLAELDPESPTAAFGRGTPRLDPAGDLHGQLDRLLAAHDPQDPAGPRRVAEGSLGLRGESAGTLREVLYGLLAHRDVTVPPGPPRVPPVPEPAPRTGDGPWVFDVCGRLAPDGAVEVRRYPVVAGLHREARGFYAVTDEEGGRYGPAAEVRARTLAAAELPAPDWLARTAARWPGLQVAVAALGEARHLLRLADGTLLEAAVPRAWGTRRARVDPLLLGSAVAVHLAHRPGPLPHTLTLRTGTRDTEVRLTAEPGQEAP